MKTNAVMMLCTAALSMLAVKADASGFYLGSQDARANGMVNAFAAVADNAAATWYNPAATVYLDGNTNISLGSAFATIKIKHQNTNGTPEDETKDKLNLLPNFYAVQKVSENMALSLGVNAPFGVVSNWEDNANTKNVALKSEVKDINYNLNLAYRFSEKFSASAGLNYGQMTATLTSATTEIDADKSKDGYGWNVGLMYKPSDTLSFGATYRSSVKATLYGGRFKVAAYAVDLPVEAELEVPDLATVGAAWKANEKWLFSLQGDYANWTTYDELKFINSDTGNVIDLGAGPVIQRKGFGPAYSVRFGTQYTMNSKWKLRGGLAYDTNPVYSKYFETRVPDSDRIEIGIGATYQFNDSFTMDISYLRAQFLKRNMKGSHATGTAADATIDGTYRTNANLPAISFAYKF